MKIDVLQSKTQPMKKFVLLFALSISFSFVGNALTRTSIAQGNWSDPFIWSPTGVPMLSDDTIIVATGVNFFGQNITFGNSLFWITNSGSLSGSNTDSLTFGGDYFLIEGYFGVGFLSVGANDSMVNHDQIEVLEFLQSSLLVNQNAGRICVSVQLATSDDVVNNGSISSGMWINSAIVTGSGGQFCISGNFINSDAISGNIDICDASPGGFGDVNVGTIAGSVTYCQAGPCLSCVMPGIQESQLLSELTIQPHPVNSISLLELTGNSNYESSAKLFVVFDVSGRVVKTISFSGKQLYFDRTGIESGIYLYQVVAENVMVATGKLAVE